MDDSELIAAIPTAGMLPTLPMPRRGSGVDQFAGLVGHDTPLWQPDR